MSIEEQYNLLTPEQQAEFDAKMAEMAPLIDRLRAVSIGGSYGSRTERVGQ